MPKKILFLINDTTYAYNLRRELIGRTVAEGNEVVVTVGSVIHPMAEEHSILWICLETDKGVYRKYLEVGKAPVAVFSLVDEKPVAVYAYCNLHGLWKKEI